MKNNKFYNDFTMQIPNVIEIFNLNSQKLIEKYFEMEVLYGKYN